jgi:Kef-type K+ transport system membrane component KefB
VTAVTAMAANNSASRATPQGGILENENPSVYDPKNPIIIFIIQAGVILIVCRLLHYPLSRLRQPRVIAEVIGGILLGPSIFGRIPGFTAAIFPPASIPNLTLVANLGLVLFLFLVGLEVDVRLLASNARVAAAVGLGGILLPFGLGCGIAWGLYHEFPATTPIAFGKFMLFVGVAMAITAFPVLCRILSEEKLLGTPVGLIVLSAGVSNDVIGWVLLALCVALVNAGSGLSALWILLTCVGYALFLVFLLRPAFIWILKKTRSLQDGPSQGIVALTLLFVLASAFFTGIIGVHPIFGAFMVGVICPHHGGFAIRLTEKIEDIVGALFLPLYFALSGLSTNLGLLNTGLVWAYVIGIIAVAFFGKFIGASVASRLCGLVWRESFAIGALMSCKGLVELIVLVSRVLITVKVL